MNLKISFIDWDIVHWIFWPRMSTYLNIFLFWVLVSPAIPSSLSCQLWRTITSPLKYNLARFTITSCSDQLQKKNPLASSFGRNLILDSIFNSYLRFFLKRFPLSLFPKLKTASFNHFISHLLRCDKKKEANLLQQI